MGGEKEWGRESEGGIREKSILVLVYSGHMTCCCYLGNGEDHVSGGGEGTYLTSQLVSQDLGQDHADGLPKHHSFCLNSTHTCQKACKDVVTHVSRSLPTSTLQYVKQRQAWEIVICVVMWHRGWCPMKNLKTLLVTSCQAFPISFCMLQAIQIKIIKIWSQGRPGNEAKIHR